MTMALPVDMAAVATRGIAMVETSAESAIDVHVLPICGQWWVYLGPVNGPGELPVPVGLPVHNVAAGRVVSVDRLAVGAVVVVSNDWHYHYRRLKGSSIRVKPRDRIGPGALIGVVAPAADGSLPVFEFAVQDPTGASVDPFPLLAGAADPSEYRVAATGPTPDPMAIGVDTSQPQRAPAPVAVREIVVADTGDEAEPRSDRPAAPRGLVATRPGREPVDLPTPPDQRPATEGAPGRAEVRPESGSESESRPESDVHDDRTPGTTETEKPRAAEAADEPPGRDDKAIGGESSAVEEPAASDTPDDELPAVSKLVAPRRNRKKPT